MKINGFFETCAGSLNGYTELANVMVNTDGLPSVLETDVEIKGVEGTFNVRCFDGIALGVGVNHNVNVVVKYPKKLDMTHEQLKDCLTYRGLDEYISVIGELTRTKVTYGDIMVRLGEPIFLHYKR
jgi:hypothetical protein